MAAVALTTANALWLRIERTMIMLLAVAYVGNTIAELADMIGIIMIHPPETRSVFAALFITCDLGPQHPHVLVVVLAD